MTSHYEGPSIDHSLISPCGRLSRRAKAAAIARHQAEVDAWWARKHPAPSPEAVALAERKAKAETLRRSAAGLREFAARGYRVRYHLKHAERLEAEAAALEAV